jgi:hypothetical protein
VTGTPYRKFTVQKEGYIPYGAPIPVYPAKGERIDLNVTLKPSSSATMAMAVQTTKAPFPSEIVVLALLIGCMMCIANRGKAR